MKEALNIIAGLIGIAWVIGQLPTAFYDLIGKKSWVEFGNPETGYRIEYCKQSFWFSGVKRYAVVPEKDLDPHGIPRYITCEELPDGKLGKEGSYIESIEIRPPILRLPLPFPYGNSFNDSEN